jgi:hypothetical protein
MSLKLGKLPARVDSRTLKLNMFLNVPALPPLPESFDMDNHLNVNIPLNMLGNDKWGDCVIVGRANWTLRAEAFEQQKVLNITTQECLDEYWKEEGWSAPKKKKCIIQWGMTPTNPPDNGLNMLDSLKEWRKDGWTTSENTYTIHAFAAINIKNHEELCYATYLLNGGYIGFQVPSSAITQFNFGQTWTVVPGSSIEGGHCVYIVGFNQTGPVCVTWAKKQQMTWEFFDKYCDEAYAIVDTMDAFMENSPVDVNKLEEYLTAVTA